MGGTCGIMMIHLYPFAAHAIASPIPVLPDVPSTTVMPGLSLPARSASSSMFLAMRSLMEPPGFCISNFTYTAFALQPSGSIFFSWTMGVLPTVLR
jgi:hypothetical protein